MLIKDFTDILAWQKSQALAVAMITTLGPVQDLTLKYEIIKSALAIPSSIAAGFERWSLGDFKEFLYMAKAKASETRTLLLIAKDIQELSEDIVGTLIAQTEDVSKLIYGFIRVFIDKKGKKVKEDEAAVA